MRTDDALPDALGRRTATLFASGAYSEYAYDFDRIEIWTVSAASLSVYRHGAKRDERLMGSGWWKKDCF
jgi:hypothetical protein